jgi:DNA mismatch repair ATPase MutL
LQTQIDKLQLQLDEVQKEYRELMTQYLQCRAELKRERILNEIALQFIPEEEQANYDDACPHGQPVWEPSSPLKVRLRPRLLNAYLDRNSEAGKAHF